MSGFFFEPMEQGFSFESTILTYGLTDPELAIINECVKNKTTYNSQGRQKPLQIYHTDELTDIYALPYFLAFINMETIDKVEQEELLNFWKDSKEPLPPDLNFEQQDLNFNIYLFNRHGDIKYEIPGIYEDDTIFQDFDRLKLNILSILKDNEGVGRNASQSSIRIYRVLNMYKYLIKDGFISKEKVDQLCYPDIISKRMFYRDIEILREIEEGNLFYDRKLKCYRLK